MQYQIIMPGGDRDRSLVLVITAIAILAAATTLRAAGLPPIDKQTVMAALEHHEGQLRDFQCQFTLKQTLTKEGLADRIEFDRRNGIDSAAQEQVLRHVSMERAGKRYRYEFDNAEHYKDRKINSVNTFANDGQVLTSLTVSPQSHKSGTVDREAGIKYGYPSPEKFGMGVGSTPLGQFFKEHPEVNVAGSERVGGAECYVVECRLEDGSTFRFWLDPNRGFRAPKIQLVDRDHVLVGEAHSEFHEIDGVWFPKSGQCVYYKKGEDGKAVATQIEMLSLNVESLKVNSNIPAERFRIQFPRGTVVADKIKNISYVIPGDPEVDAYWDGIVASRVQKAQSLAKEQGIGAAAGVVLQGTAAPATVQPVGVSSSEIAETHSKMLVPTSLIVLAGATLILVTFCVISAVRGRRA